MKRTGLQALRAVALLAAAAVLCLTGIGAAAWAVDALAADGSTATHGGVR